jgi:pyridoxamine 5'-phosphate oxidase-like protein
MTDQVVDENRRRLTREESVELLGRPIAGVLCTLSEGGWIHAVPVHYLYADGEVRILAGVGDVKTRNAVRTGKATLCVEVTDGPVRSYVSLPGAVTTRQPPPSDDLAAMDERYSRTDFSSGWDEADLAAAVMLVLRPERWIAWADWD